jgi:hypothetical protein
MSSQVQWLSPIDGEFALVEVITAAMTIDFK